MTSKAVREQYEAYPYPPRTPADERVRLENSWYDFLEMINFYCFQGKNNFSQNFRVLVAGGGTGDQTIFLAEQLRYNRYAEIVHLDISATSLSIARRRADVRRLHNITWHHTSLLELPSLGLGQFDYINCAGVLHHLEDPAAGLAALTSVLKEHGAMMIMLYGQYGRTGVYHVQELMRRINGAEQSMPVKIANTKAVLDALPKTNWFKRGEDLIGDHKDFGDAGICDVFLHARDRPYSVGEVYELVEGAGLTIIELLERGKAKYRVETYLKDPAVLEKIQTYPLKEQQAIAEIMAGDLIVHNFYAGKNPNVIASIEDPRNVPFYFLYSPGDLSKTIDKNPGRPILIESQLFDAHVEFMPGPHTGSIFKHLDGERSLKEIFELVRKDCGLREDQLSNDELLKEFRPIYDRFDSVGWMLLRHKSVGKFRSLEDMQRPPV